MVEVRERQADGWRRDTPDLVAIERASEVEGGGEGRFGLFRRVPPSSFGGHRRLRYLDQFFQLFGEIHHGVAIFVQLIILPLEQL